MISARDLEEALAAGDDEDVAALANDLLEAALAREDGGVTAGFGAEPGIPAAAQPAEPATVEEELSLALTELEIGEVLLAGSASIGAASAENALSTLSEAVDQLDHADALIAEAGRPAVAGFGADEHLDPEKFFSQLPNTVGGIVERTSILGRAALDGLAIIPGVHVQSVISGALAALPQLGALANAGLRAIKRALAALAKLIPDGVGEQIRDWAKQWWDQRGASVIDTVVRRMLAVPTIEAEIAESVRTMRDRQDPANAVLLHGMHDLEQIEARHARVTHVIDKVMKVLSRLTGALAVALVSAAGWIYAAGAFGLLTALGIGIWLGRDYLDAGIRFERVPGVRKVLSVVAG